MLGKKGFFAELMGFVVVCVLIFVGVNGVVAFANGMSNSPVSPVVYQEITPLGTWGQVTRETRAVWGLGTDTRSHVHAARTSGTQNVTARAWVVDTGLPVDRQTRINQATGTRAGWIDLRNPWTGDPLSIMGARGNWE